MSVGSAVRMLWVYSCCSSVQLRKLSLANKRLSSAQRIGLIMKYLEQQNGRVVGVGGEGRVKGACGMIIVLLIRPGTNLVSFRQVVCSGVLF